MIIGVRRREAGGESRMSDAGCRATGRSKRSQEGQPGCALSSENILVWWPTLS
jgi:hypothetical protein